MKETKNAETKKVYSYYICEGNFEEDADGVRHICIGHKFTLKTNLTNCPVCGKKLKILQSETEIDTAITLAFEKCFKCINREKSAAVNDLHCLGGQVPNGYGLRNVKGTHVCNGCLCTKCCNELIEDFNIGVKYDFFQNVAVRRKISDLAKYRMQHEITDSEMEQRIKELRTGNKMLEEMPDGIFYRWLYSAYEKARKEAKKSPKTNGVNTDCRKIA
jgi:C4-type Zn-finger protein